MGRRHEQTVEERLMLARQNMALLASLARAEALALTAKQDLSTSPGFSEAAKWCALRLLEDSVDHISSAEDALGDAMSEPAPSAREAA